jgi:Sporulation and spore germination
MIPRNVAITIALLIAAVVGMGIYGLHLRKQALQLQASAATDSRPIAPPVSGPTQKITVFLPDDNTGTLLRRDIAANLPDEPTMRAREIVHTLISKWQEKDSLHPTSNAADVNAVFLLDNNRTAIVDVNGAFADQHRSGVLVEELTLVAVAKTIGANVNGVTSVRFLVDGKERETLAGHADLSDGYNPNLEWHVE